MTDHRHSVDGASACDPTWNDLARAVLVYAIPFALLGLCLQQGWVGASRDFWVPLIWGFCVPSIATGSLLGKPWVFKDFLNRDFFPPTVALIHAGFWVLALQLAGSTVLVVPVFMAIMLVFDGALLHYGVLQVRSLPRQIHERGTLVILLAFGLVWWLHVGTAFALVHAYGGDTLGSILFWSVVTQIPALGLFAAFHSGAARPERLRAEKVAVIGAGFSGCYATKWLRELGAEVTCFEASDDLGGVWKYRPDRPGGVFEKTRATSSKHFLHAMDFLLPADSLDFPHHTKLLAFLNDYVDHFGIRDRIRLDAKVLAARKRAGTWYLTIESATGDREEHLFDAVVVCAGPQGRPRVQLASDPLYSCFAGKVIHAAEYKRARDLGAGERLLVVGAGESAADIVHECAEAGLTVHWSTHRGQWFADRNIGPYPADHFSAVGIRAWLGGIANVEYLVRRLVIANFINLVWGRGGHGFAAWAPAVPYLAQFLSKSREGILDVYRGAVAVHGPVEAISGNSVCFAGGESIEVDCIIVAAGYRPHWPFLEEQPARLYKKVFDPADPTLACIGLARPALGSIPALAEMQARWVASVYGGRATLPDPERRDLIAWLDARAHTRRFLDTSPYGSLCDHEVYATELATEMGIQVRWLRLLLTSPRVFWTALISPWIACKYMVHDRDPDKRAASAAHMRRELPEAASSVYLLVGLLGTALAVTLLGFSVLFWLLPAHTVLWGSAVFVLLAAVIFRLVDRVRQPV